MKDKKLKGHPKTLPLLFVPCHTSLKQVLKIPSKLKCTIIIAFAKHDTISTVW